MKNEEITLHLNSHGWQIWYAYYKRLGVPPPASDGNTVMLTKAAAAYIFGDQLAASLEGVAQ